MNWMLVAKLGTVVFGLTVVASIILKVWLNHRHSEKVETILGYLGGPAIRAAYERRRPHHKPEVKITPDVDDRPQAQAF